MSSKNRQNRRVIDSSSPEPLEANSTIGSEGPISKRRQATVYDAVAGRVTTTLPLNYTYTKQPRKQHHKPHAPGAARDPTLAPEEVLFQRSRAPIRYTEKDIYHAHEDLPDGGRDILPDSNLLKNIHNYTSHFYKDLPANQRWVHDDTGEGISERSMDETAMLAFGMLLEEASREALGKNGDLVFTEGVEVAEDGRSHNENEDPKVYGFMDGPKYEARALLTQPQASVEEATISSIS
ncbi:hypothetical protein GGS21DRAFT_487813 [Xylaria nigripes]|nr:hypothetical protein GGS21DRAFT_487813 [Xylaria nigripes]